jgi:hypothetical protein
MHVKEAACRRTGQDGLAMFLKIPSVFSSLRDSVTLRDTLTD